MEKNIPSQLLDGKNRKEKKELTKLDLNHRWAAEKNRNEPTRCMDAFCNRSARIPRAIGHLWYAPCVDARCT